MSKKTVIQTHHFSYDPDIHGACYKGEHHILTLLDRRKRFSRYFLRCLKAKAALMEHLARELDETD